MTIRSGGINAGYERPTLTDSRGSFFFSELPPGDYRVSAASTGFRSWINDVKVFVDDVRVLNITLDVGSSSAVVDIRPESPAGSADPTPEIRTNFNASYLDRLPSRTTFGSLVKIVPNARPESLVAGFQIDGNSGADNTYFVDGQEVTNSQLGLLPVNFDLPFEQLSEFQVRSSPIAAEYSGAVGGAITLVTRGGGNAWRGEFGLSLNPAGLQGSPNATLTRFGTGIGQTEYFKPNKDGGNAFFPSVSVGGPIFRDRLWFFASYAPQMFDTERKIDYYANGTNPATRTITESINYNAKVKGEQALLRLDAQPSSRVRMFGTYIYNPWVFDGTLPSQTEGLGGAPQQVLGLRGAEYLATRGGRLNSQLISGQATIDVNRRLAIVARAGYGFLNEKPDSYGIPKVTRFICASGSPTPSGAGCSPGFQNVASNSVRDYDVSERSTFDIEAQINGINFAGRHFFKFGYGFNRVLNKLREGYTDTGIVQLFYGRPIDVLGVPVTPTPGNLGSGFLQRFGTVGEAAGTLQSIYGQDSWTIGRLTVNLGARIEQENIPKFGEPTYPGSTIVIGEEFDGKWNWTDKFAPRVSGVFDITGDGRGRLFSSFGFYYDRLKFNSLRSLFSDIFYRDFFEILPSRGAAYTNYTFQNILGNNQDTPGGRCPIVGGSGWSVCQFSFAVQTNIPVIVGVLPVIASDLKPSRTREFTLVYEHRIGFGLRASARYIFRNLDRAVEDVGTFNDQGSEQYTVANPGFGDVCLVSESANLPCPKAKRRYDALEIIIDKRGPRYFFNASYTFSRLTGNYSGLSNSDEAGLTTPNSGRFFDLPMAGFNADGDPDNGPLATDRPHVFNVYGGYNFAWNQVNRTSVSAISTFRSGTPLTTVYSLYSVTNSILFGRGDLSRTELFTETDLRIGHRYLFGRDKRLTLEPFVVVLNLFDERNELGRQTQISSTNFTSTTLTQGGCTTCTSQAAVIQTIHSNGGISRFVQNYLSSRGTSSAGLRNDYNLANSFQSPRSVRFGVRLLF